MNILILSESFIVKDSLGHLINELYEDICIENFTNTKEIDNIDFNKFDLMFIDTKGKNIKELEFVFDIKNKFINIKVVLLDLYKNKELYVKAIKSGLDGYIHNVSDKEEFIYILKKIVKGKKYYDSELLQESMIGSDNTNDIYSLTQKEKLVLAQVSKGLTNKEIADKLNVTDYTIKKHVSSILNKLSLKNRQDIIIYSRDNNIIKEIV